ncbi:hypothetical protein OS493_028942 [Desmophyllum pertusum]|uniref:Uncharacterized protein n=1 Tax=Desmophyllum pertusum TaxID=174260 RepID=A0A9W9Z9H6_9CNID|nr:hypothetical protein OS493_028942 [Desmophyllum pertusum]
MEYLCELSFKAHDLEWQQELGFFPVMVGVGELEKGKAGNIALAALGIYPSMFFTVFTYAHNGQVAVQTAMGFQVEDPTDPSEIAKVTMAQMPQCERGILQNVHPSAQSTSMW